MPPRREASPSQPNESANAPLIAALTACLAPLVKLLIARGFTFQMASEVLKRVYVEVAEKQYGDDTNTGTRLSLLTGLNRKEIKRLTSDATVKTPDSMVSFAAAIHGTWSSDRRFRHKNGKPLALPRRATDGALCFDDLVRLVTTDHRPSALLDELVRLQVVEVDADEVVHLVEGPFLSRRTLSDRLIHLADNVADHTNAVVANVLTDPPPYLERSVFADELSATSAAALAARAREHWDRLHTDMMDRAIALEADDAKDGGPAKTRIRVGMYFYSESQE